MENTQTVQQVSGIANEGVGSPAAVMPEGNEIHRVNLRSFLQSKRDSFVGLDFVKLDGSERRLVGRLGVRKHLSGGHNLVEAAERPYLTFFDMQAKGYRAVNLATVKCVRVNRRAYNIVG